MSTHLKTYHRAELKWQKQREIDFLHQLDGLPHFPQIVGVDESGIHMTHCGEKFTKESLANVDLDIVEIQLNSILLSLESWCIRHRDITVNNLTWKDGMLYLVDFGWSIWDSEDDTPVPVPQVMREWMCNKTDKQQAKETMAKLRAEKG